jgi:hypothetical protein
VIRRTKFNTKSEKKDKPVYNGMRFDSDKEMEYFKYLEIQIEKGYIAKVERQIRVVLIDKFQIFTRKIREASIVIDFKVYLKNGSYIYQDYKGMATPTAKLQKKIFESRYKEPLQWITWSGIDGGWCDYDLVQKNRALRKKARGGK